MNVNKIIYWASTAIFCGIMLFSGTMYFTKYDMVKGFFETLGYPTYLIYPLATAKILGVIAILTKKSNILKEWAYAGFFFDATLAAMAHWSAKDGGHVMVLVVLAAIVVSRVFEERLFKMQNI